MALLYRANDHYLNWGKFLFALNIFILLMSALQAQPGEGDLAVFRGFFRHPTGENCNHLPPEVGFIVYLNGADNHILSHQAPRWSPESDPNIPGAEPGSFNLELGNLKNPEVAEGDSFFVRFTCVASQSQIVLGASIPTFAYLSVPGFYNLNATDLPTAPQNVALRPTDSTWTVIWNAEPGLTYQIYRRNDLDILATGKPRFQYEKVADGLTVGPFADTSTVAGDSYRYLLFARNDAGIYSAASQEAAPPIYYTGLHILPDPPVVIPGTTLQLSLELVDDEGLLYPDILDGAVIWTSSNISVATVDSTGALLGMSVGTTLITVVSDSLSGSATAHVVTDFESPKAQTLTIKVALVLQNPVIDSTNMRKINQVRGWVDPLNYVNQLLTEFSQMSDGVVNFQIVETHDDEGIFTRLSGEFMTLDTLTYYYSSGKWSTELRQLAEGEGKVKFDYNAMVDYYDLDTKRNDGVIDEVWVYAHPFAGMWESQLMGPGAFWWNSPPLSHPGLDHLLSVMGWNYERGVPEALESFGHRTESAMCQTYGRWDVLNEDPNNWEIFTRIDINQIGQAHVGNIHFPPNGDADYDHSNSRFVISYAENWKRYPNLLNQNRAVNCEAWDCTYIGHMRWFYNHLPRYTGITDGILNNWWHYVVDYEGATNLASGGLGLTEGQPYRILTPPVFRLGSNYPNPFNPLTTIPYYLSEAAAIKISVYNLLGELVTVLVAARQQPGRHFAQWEAGGHPSGIYFVRLEANGFTTTEKLALLK